MSLGGMTERAEDLVPGHRGPVEQIAEEVQNVAARVERSGGGDAGYKVEGRKLPCGFQSKMRIREGSGKPWLQFSASMLRFLLLRAVFCFLLFSFCSASLCSSFCSASFCSAFFCRVLPCTLFCPVHVLPGTLFCPVHSPAKACFVCCSACFRSPLLASPFCSVLSSCFCPLPPVANRVSLPNNDWSFCQCSHRTRPRQDPKVRVQMSSSSSKFRCVPDALRSVNRCKEHWAFLPGPSRRFSGALLPELFLLSSSVLRVWGLAADGLMLTLAKGQHFWRKTHFSPHNGGK